ncbi:uncharacterized protein LOC112593635 [Melanaphis sacchari]|uniref:uncharacterized protein LOC112593635 n=1 Tax=Melanaphis sacchari TaxID=742174 RepID=UPI000DC147B7|nr:uncharacterized protein LOC112593635 [Melanaphis sacchari]
MVACKVILAIAVVFLAATQINGKPSTNPDTEWSIPFEEALKNITKKMSDVVSDNSEYTTAAKNSLNNFVEGFKSELAVLSKSFEGKAGVSDVVKEATKQWQSAVDTYTKNLPKELSLKDFNEKSEQALKYIVEHATNISKKAQGNTDIEKEVKEFTKKNIDLLIEQVKSVEAKIIEGKKA